jgi:hypothetical protein
MDARVKPAHDDSEFLFSAYRISSFVGVLPSAYFLITPVAVLSDRLCAALWPLGRQTKIPYFSK